MDWIRLATTHELTFFYIAIISTSINIFLIFTIKKIYSNFIDLQTKLDDTQKMIEFLITRLINITMTTTEDILLLKDSLSDISSPIIKIIEKKIDQGLYKKQENKINDIYKYQIRSIHGKRDFQSREFDNSGIKGDVNIIDLFNNLDKEQQRELINLLKYNVDIKKFNKTNLDENDEE